MKKILSIISFVFIIFAMTSCVQSEKGWYYHHSTYVVVDENKTFDNNYYVKYENYENQYKTIFYEKSTNEVVEEIIIYDSWKHTYSIYDDYLYYINTVDEEGLIYYSYKKIGDKETSLEKNMKIIDITNFNGFININENIFYIPNWDRLLKVDFNIDQIPPYNGNVHSVYNSVKNPKSYSLNIIDEEKVVLESVDKSEKYTFDISLEVKNAKYKKHTNYRFYDVFNFIEPDDIPKYDLYKPVVILEDDNLYFSYGKYLGEFENAKHCCFQYLNCLFSNRVSEILRFNNSTKQIESVAILPEGFTPLKIYLDKAIVMKNNIIAEYNYQTKELSNKIEVDWTKYYELDSWSVIKLLFEDNKLIDVDVYYCNKYGFNNFDVR